MKKIIAITVCLLIICSVMFYFVSLPRNVSDITATDGVLSLEGTPNISKTLFNLDGEWEFYFNEFYTPEDFKSGKPESGRMIGVPGSWSEADYPVKGFATYRLTRRGQ